VRAAIQERRPQVDSPDEGEDVLSGRISAGLAALLLVSPLMAFATLSQMDSWNVTVRAGSVFYVVSATTLVAASPWR
jgi:hypothetical protein